MNSSAERRAPVRRDGGGPPTTATTSSSRPARGDGAAEDRQGVHQPDLRVDEARVVVLPAGLVLLRAAVVVEGEDGAVGGLCRGAEVDRRLAAVGPDLQGRPAARCATRGRVEEGTLVLGHEALGGEGVLEQEAGMGRRRCHSRREEPSAGIIGTRSSFDPRPGGAACRSDQRRPRGAGGRPSRSGPARSGGIEAAREAEDDPLAGSRSTSRAVAEMGLAAIALPESVGGAGGSLLDLAVALEAAAAALVPGPAARHRRRRRGRCDELAGPRRSPGRCGSALALGRRRCRPRRPRGHPRPGRRRRRRTPGPARRGRADARTLNPDLSRRTSPRRPGRRSTATVVPGLTRPGCAPSSSPWPPPRPRASPAGAWTRRWSTPRSASSSARRSAPSRRSSTCAPRCWRPASP